MRQENRDVLRSDSLKSVGSVAVVSLLATVGVLFGFDNQPYGYYMLLRLFLCGASLFFLMGAKLRLADWQRWALGGFAVLYNPVLPIRIGEKVIWEAVNLVTVGLFWVVTLKASRN
jgi:hypothetical protein